MAPASHSARGLGHCREAGRAGGWVPELQGACQGSVLLLPALTTGAKQHSVLFLSLHPSPSGEGGLRATRSPVPLPPASYSVLTSGFSELFLCPGQPLMTYFHLTALAPQAQRGQGPTELESKVCASKGTTFAVRRHLSCLEPDSWTYVIPFILIATQQSRQGHPGRLGSLCTAQRLLAVVVSS